MPTVVVTFKSKNVRIKVPLERDLFWYDNEKKKTLRFRGGSLRFVHKYDDEFKKYRLLPEVQDIKGIGQESVTDEEDIMKLYNRFSGFNVHTDITSKNDDSIEFSVPEDELVDFVDELDRANFNYEVG